MSSSTLVASVCASFRCRGHTRSTQSICRTCDKNEKLIPDGKSAIIWLEGNVIACHGDNTNFPIANIIFSLLNQEHITTKHW